MGKPSIQFVCLDTKIKGNEGLEIIFWKLVWLLWKSCSLTPVNRLKTQFSTFPSTRNHG